MVLSTKAMKISVIIPCYNAANTLAVQLEALANQQQWLEPWEVIISDNGSTDESVKIAQRFQKKLPNLRIVDSSERKGAAYARNVAVKTAAGEALAFCDADDEIDSRWIAAMGEALSKYDVVCGQIDFEKFNDKSVVARKSRLWRNGFSYSSGFMPHGATCNLGVKRSAHEAIGGFDENLLRNQDIDYCWRLQLKGFKLHYCPEALVHYRTARASLAIKCRRIRMVAESQVLLYKKYRSLGMLPKHTWKTIIKNWLILLKRMPLSIYSKEKRNRWLWECLREFLHCRAKLEGMIKYRSLVP